VQLGLLRDAQSLLGTHTIYSSVESSFEAPWSTNSSNSESRLERILVSIEYGRLQLKLARVEEDFQLFKVATKEARESIELHKTWFRVIPNLARTIKAEVYYLNAIAKRFDDTVSTSRIALEIARYYRLLELRYILGSNEVKAFSYGKPRSRRLRAPLAQPPHSRSLGSRLLS
jgi:hypothetical protein